MGTGSRDAVSPCGDATTGPKNPFLMETPLFRSPCMYDSVENTASNLEQLNQRASSSDEWLNPQWIPRDVPRLSDEVNQFRSIENPRYAPGFSF